MDWVFSITFGLGGLLLLLSGIYEWVWVWKLGRGGYLPNQIGWRNTRLLYMFSGAGALGVAISLILQALFSNDSLLFFVVGCAISITLTVILFNSREDRSIVDFIFHKDERE